jgi:hypothetical protein
LGSPGGGDAGYVGEPVNAWSDFSFLAVGFFMIYCGVHNMLWPVQNSKGEKTVNPIVSFPIVSIVWGGTFVTSGHQLRDRMRTCTDTTTNLCCSGERDSCVRHVLVPLVPLQGG